MREVVPGNPCVLRGKRKSTSAPRFTISRTKSALESRPAPFGGAPSLRSFESGLRTPGIKWRAVNPVRTSLGSAPASTSAIASSKWPFRTAICKGHRAGGPPLNFQPSAGRIIAFTSTPASINARTTSRWPSRTESKNGVNPESSRAFTPAPASIRARTTSTWPSAAAHIKAVWFRRSR